MAQMAGRKRVSEGVLFGVEFVLVEGVRAAALRAEAAVGGVEVDDRFGAGRNVSRVLGGVEVFGGVVADVELEERGGSNAEGGGFGFTGGRNFEPADVGVVTVFLGHDVVHVFGGDGGLVAGDEAAVFAVGVVFDGAASEVGEIFVAGHEVETDADEDEVLEAAEKWVLEQRR